MESCQGPLAAWSRDGGGGGGGGRENNKGGSITGKILYGGALKALLHRGLGRSLKLCNITYRNHSASITCSWISTQFIEFVAFKAADLVRVLLGL